MGNNFVDQHFHSHELGSMVGSPMMIGQYYKCKHCDKEWAFALTGSYNGGASLQTVRILQHVEPHTGEPDIVKTLVGHLKDAHSIKPLSEVLSNIFSVAAVLGMLAILIGLLVGLYCF
jgi:hypothetical protein